MERAQPADEQPDEELLVERARQGDRAAFEALVRLFQDRIYQYAVRLVGTDAAEDIAQEVLIRVYRSLGAFESRARLGTWIYRITTNACLDWMRIHTRRTGRVVPLDGPAGEGGRALSRLLTDDRPGPEQELERRELEAIVRRALARLSEKHRAVLVLHDLEGLHYQEVAAVVGCSVGTVKSRLFHARRALRRILEPELARL